MKTKRITEAEFTERVINKELEMVNAPIRYKDLIGKNKDKYPTWFSDYEFESEEQFNEWKRYWLEQSKLVKGNSHLTKAYLEQAFGWFNLSYGLTLKK